MALMMRTLRSWNR